MQAYGDANLVPIAVPEICWNVYIYIYIKSVKSESLPLLLHAWCSLKGHTCLRKV